MENVIWRDIQGYEGLYQISSNGNVKSLNYRMKGKEHILKLVKNNFGYNSINLWKNGKIKLFLVHRLVATAFIPNPNNLPQVNHKDEDKTNNRIDNLEWCTQTYNINYGTRNERSSKTLKGRKFSQEWKEKMSKAHKGKKLSQECKEKISKTESIPIVQLDLQGNYIATHQSATQVKKDFGFSQGNINQCCKGKLKTAYKFKWMYLSDWEKRKAV